MLHLDLTRITCIFYKLTWYELNKYVLACQVVFDSEIASAQTKPLGDS